MTKIILVDDDLSSSNLLKMFLEFETFHVVSARDLEQARAALDANTAAVLLDYHLGRDVNGLDLLDEIRSGETNAIKDTPVIVTSGDDRANRSAIEQGANAFMQKPFGPAALVDVLNNLLTENSTI